MEATPDQRQRLIEAIFKRNYARRKNTMPPLDVQKSYALGLNRILRANLIRSNNNITYPKRIAEHQKSAEIIWLSNTPTHETSSSDG